MREALDAAAGEYQFYHARHAGYERSGTVPFQVSPTPIDLDSAHQDTIARIGIEGAAFLQAADDLYHTDERAAALLDTGKPEVFKASGPAKYLFFRPDLLIGVGGIKICEIETSPFGLGLAHLLNQTYADEGFETVVDPDILPAHVAAHTPDEGTIVWDDKTASYRGQLGYLAAEVFSADLDRQWTTMHASEVSSDEDGALYRAFYLHSYLGDQTVQRVVDTRMADFTHSLSPHMEEKALLAFIWDKRFERPLRDSLGDASFDFLRSVIPPTWVVGQEEHFAPGLPNGFEDSTALASLSRKQRKFVLKSSGFSPDASWAESVKLLQEQSQQNAGDLLHAAAESSSALHVIQEFTEGIKFPLEYDADGEGQRATMLGRLRLTPYYDTSTGRLLTMKATSRANTHYIHASTDSINTAVAA